MSTDSGGRWNKTKDVYERTGGAKKPAATIQPAAVEDTLRHFDAIVGDFAVITA